MFILLSVLLAIFMIGSVFLASLFYTSKKQISLMQQRHSFVNTEFAKVIAREHENTIKMIELKNQIDANVYKDTLTGLVSRQIFEDRLEQMINQSARHELIFAVLFLNLDGFKIINEALGLDAGDGLLKEVARRLQGSIRQLDTVSRFAGDEFVFILPQLAKPETAAYVAKRILDAIALPFKVNEQEVFVTASIGIAIFPDDGNEGKQLLKNADNALHQAKSHNHHSYQFYRQEMYVSSQRELIINSSLHSQTIYQDFLIYYQPQVNIETKKIISMEALLRWNHPTLGLIDFKDFLRFSENNGTIESIGEWVLHHACQQFQAWKSLGFFIQSFSVNISARQLENPHFTYKVSQILQECGLSPENLILEVSETMLQSSLIGEKTLLMLKELGVRVGVNDFGTGHIALWQLQTIPVNILKIASTHIQNITINQDTAAIVKMIIALGNTLGVAVVATDVVNKKQVQLLKSLGCQLMQGSIFTPPLLPHEFTMLVEKSIVEGV